METEVVIVMERPVGYVSLKDFFDHRGRLEDWETRIILSQVTITCNGLIELGIFHGDLKPANILINPENLIVRMINFGLGTVVQKVHRGRFGTAAYMCPEMLSNRCYMVQGAMVWSLGVLLMKMLTECDPFFSKEQILRGHFYVPSYASKSCRRVIERCLSRDAKFWGMGQGDNWPN
jgi:serine/threonine protein kinase